MLLLLLLLFRMCVGAGVSDGAGSLVDSDRSPGKLGFDTLDELAEKQKFFQVWTFADTRLRGPQATKHGPSLSIKIHFFKVAWVGFQSMYNWSSIKVMKT